jgi:hypothetical protein
VTQFIVISCLGMHLDSPFTIINNSTVIIQIYSSIHSLSLPIVYEYISTKYILWTLDNQKLDLHPLCSYYNIYGILSCWFCHSPRWSSSLASPFSISTIDQLLLVADYKSLLLISFGVPSIQLLLIKIL